MFRWQHALSLDRISVMAGCAVSAVLGMSLMAAGQDQSVTIAKDAIFARKILMATISTNMDELEIMTTSDKGINLILLPALPREDRMHFDHLRRREYRYEDNS